MAYNSDNEVKEELASVQKNSRGDFVVASKITNKSTGSVSIDIRQFFTNDDDKLTATSKGVRFNSENLLDMLKGLAKGLEANEVMELGDALAEMLDD